MKPIAYDLCCGLGGWTEGLLADGYDAIGYDIEEHVYGEHRYPGRLVVEDILTLHGSRLKDGALIVASPPCQEYSYMAMPWKLAKAKAAAIRADTTGESLERLNRLFNTCFRIQKEASLAAGRHIPMVVENVRGAQPWVGRARWNFGSFYLWGDVPALMPATFRAIKAPGMNWSDQTKCGQDFTRLAGKHALKTIGHPNIRDGHSHTKHLANPAEHAIGNKGNWLQKPGPDGKRPVTGQRAHWSNSPGRKMASAMIAKIPLPLSRHIARTYYPNVLQAEAAE